MEIFTENYKWFKKDPEDKETLKKKKEKEKETLKMETDGKFVTNLKGLGLLMILKMMISFKIYNNGKQLESFYH